MANCRFELPPPSAITKRPRPWRRQLKWGNDVNRRSPGRRRSAMACIKNALVNLYSVGRVIVPLNDPESFWSRTLTIGARRCVQLRCEEVEIGMVL